MKNTIAENRALADSLVALDNALGVTGNEEEVAEVLKKEMAGLYDEYRTDPLGNQYYIRYGKNRDKRVLFAAHMDEIGFIIKSVDEEGFARFFPVGWHDDKMAVNQDLVFLTAEGKRVYGVTGSKPAHLMSPEDHEKAVKIRDLFVDFGTESAEETRALGIEVGDYGTFSRQGCFLNGGDYYSGKSVDNRAGLAVLVEAARRLKGQEIEPTVCFAGSVQEEVGMRGGGALATRFVPELMFAVDGTLTGGAPGLDYTECPQKMGGGVSFKYYDWEPLWTSGNNVPRKLTARMIAVAKKYGIPFQREVIMGGGTDAWSGGITGGGTLAGGIGIPMRYIHTAVGTVKLSDLAVCADFIVRYVQDYVSL
ncbi:MAG: M42 family metallopeptidase [Treponemataceae bacterium]|nr:MAG: M42 family metallopeptidase [Treponemataceae bacterium]